MTAPARVLPARVLRRAAPALLALGLAASCAPHRVAVPELDVAGRRERYLRALAARERPGRLIEAEITLWVRAHGSGRVGASGALLLSPPDAARLRLSSLFGTAIDLGTRADSVVAVIPGRRLAVAADAARDTLGIAAPGALVYRLVSGAWRPPERATWRRVPGGGAIEARWAEGPDSAALAIGSDGLPSSLRWIPREGKPWTVDYLSWTREAGVAWPEALRVAERGGGVTVTGRLSRLRVQRHADPARLAVRVPPQIEWMDWRRFRLALEEIGTWLR